MTVRRGRRLIGYAVSAALVVALASGCSLKDEEDALRAWVTAQPTVAQVTDVRASTGSIAYAWNKRGVAAVEAVPGTDAADLTTLSASLGKHLASRSAFKDIRLTVSVGPDKLTLQGRRAPDEAVITAWGSLRALSGIESVSLTHVWHATGLGEDARTRSNLEWSTAADLFGQLPAATTALAAWSPTEVDWTSRVASDQDGRVRAKGSEAAALPAQVATLLAPLADEAQASVTIGHAPRYATKTEPAPDSPERPTDLAVSLPDEASALRFHDELRATGARPPSALQVAGGGLRLDGIDAFDPADRSALDALLAADHTVRLGPSGFVVVLKHESDLPGVAALVPATRSLRVDITGPDSRLDESVRAPAGEVVALWQRFQPVRALPEVSRFKVGPDEVSLEVTPLKSGSVTPVAKALRAAGWTGTKRVSISGSVTPGNSWIPVTISFDSTATGKATGIDLPTPGSSAAKDEVKAINDAGNGVIRDWNATSTQP